MTAGQRAAARSLDRRRPSTLSDCGLFSDRAAARQGAPGGGGRPARAEPPARVSRKAAGQERARVSRKAAGQERAPVSRKAAAQERAMSHARRRHRSGRGFLARRRGRSGRCLTQGGGAGPGAGFPQGGGAGVEADLPQGGGAGAARHEAGKWQEWRDSNPRPSVLETDALTGLSYTPRRRARLLSDASGAAQAGSWLTIRRPRLRPRPACGSGRASPGRWCW
jgi:hypothetical protein